MNSEINTLADAHVFLRDHGLIEALDNAISASEQRLRDLTSWLSLLQKHSVAKQCKLAQTALLRTFSQELVPLEAKRREWAIIIWESAIELYGRIQSSTISQIIMVAAYVTGRNLRLVHDFFDRYQIALSCFQDDLVHIFAQHPPRFDASGQLTSWIESLPAQDVDAMMPLQARSFL